MLSTLLKYRLTGSWLSIPAFDCIYYSLATITFYFQGTWPVNLNSRVPPVPYVMVPALLLFYSSTPSTPHVHGLVCV